MIDPENLSDIISVLADFAVVIDKSGKIMSLLANPIHGSFTKLDQWENASIRDYLTEESRPKFDMALADHLKDPSTLRSTEVNHWDRETGVEFPVSYTLHRIGKDETILLMGRDLRAISDMQQQLVDAQIAVERDYELQRNFDTRYRVLMQSTSDAMVFVSIEQGKITDVNGAAAALLGRANDELKDTGFAALFEGPGHSELIAELAASSLSDNSSAVPLVLRNSKEKLRVIPSFFRASGTRMMLCRLEPATETRKPDDDLSTDLSALYETGPDAIVFVSQDGTVTSANDAFLDLVEVAHGQGLKGKPISDFLERGAIDLKVLLDNATRSGRMRVYATRLTGQYDSRRSVEISATHLKHDTHPSFVLVMRDAEMVDATRSRKDAEPGYENSRSVVELVGSATLKEIVAETTDVIEKMCIETATELTSNNRVAAAEMLGLSRQSLYVKLRKFGLLSR